MLNSCSQPRPLGVLDFGRSAPRERFTTTCSPSYDSFKRFLPPYSQARSCHNNDARSGPLEKWGHLPDRRLDTQYEQKEGEAAGTYDAIGNQTVECNEVFGHPAAPSERAHEAFVEFCV